jgi:predicted O-linked N-acetylglucosamine transferase (SPINDLY family)
MDSEQQLINQFHQEMSKGPQNPNLLPLVNKINDVFPNSYILQYYVGHFYKNIGSLEAAEDQFLKSINLSRFFVPPYFDLCEYYVNSERIKEAEDQLMFIFNKKTLDPTSGTRKMVHNLETDLRICSILGPAYAKMKTAESNIKAEKLHTKCIEALKKIRSLNLIQLQCWKNMHTSLGAIYMNKDPQKAYDHYIEGLEKSSTKLNSNDISKIQDMDRSLLQSSLICSNYLTTKNNLKSSLVDKLYEPFRIKNKDTCDIKEVHEKIRIGYLSPDFNKNAVGLFVEPLLNHFDKEKFDVYCYYNKENSDEFTFVFKSYVPKNRWTNTFGKSDQDVYNLMKEHEIDILVDLICHGTDNRMSLIAMKPAPIIINYLGFPGSSHLKDVDYRIVDSITDPKVSGDDSKDCSEKLICMPRCFVSYTLFAIVDAPEIEYEFSNQVLIGIFNKSSKQNSFIRKVWKKILEKNRQVVLCIKLDQNEIEQSRLYADFPKGSVRYFQFTDTLDDYLELYNKVDFCIDTYPYSGTTTTCSSLLMGVPTFTVYNKNNRHVSNVSTSILLNTSPDLDKYVCQHTKDYVEKISEEIRNRLNDKKMDKDLFVKKADENRELIRKQFYKAMDSDRFMKEYETELLKIEN